MNSLLKELQLVREELAAETFPKTATKSSLARALNVAEEAGELARAERLRVDDPEGEELDAEDAVGDIVIALAGYCSARGFDLEECVTTAWERIEQRWRDHRRRGVPQ